MQNLLEHVTLKLSSRVCPPKMSSPSTITTQTQPNTNHRIVISYCFSPPSPGGITASAHVLSAVYGQP